MSLTRLSLLEHVTRDRCSCRLHDDLGYSKKNLKDTHSLKIDDLFSNRSSSN